MKTIKIFSLIVILAITACENALKEETFSILGPTNYYQTAKDAETLLNGLYAVSQSQGYRDIMRDHLTFGEFTTDIAIERQGGINTYTQPIEDFQMPVAHAYLDSWWDRYYVIIYRANNILENVPPIVMNESRKEVILAEARFLRAMAYFYLYDLFGPVPLILTGTTSILDRPVRAEKAEYIEFVKDELRAASEDLPAVQSQYGRATKGAALGFLCKMYLNNKDWADAASVAQEIIGSSVYSLFTTGKRTDLFALENEINNEFMFVVPFPKVPESGLGNTYLSHAAPPQYQWKWPPKTIFAANFKIRSEYLQLFEPQDERLGAFLFEYINQAGKLIVLGTDDARSFKYPEDQNGSGDVAGNDYPLLRYADILLARAEALNEINGPDQEAVDLLMEVRNAAGASVKVLEDFPTRESLRDFILDERGREFHTEGLIRRQDLIRHGKFISMAVARGKAAQAHHVLFPIPQTEIDKNPNLVQNPGYPQ